MDEEMTQLFRQAPQWMRALFLRRLKEMIEDESLAAPLERPEENEKDAE